MYTAHISITKLFDPEILPISDKTLTVRWLVGLQHDKKIAFKLWNDLTTHPKLRVNTELEVEFRIESREAKGRFFTDLTITKIL